jgi:hypothetical protein
MLKTNPKYAKKQYAKAGRPKNTKKGLYLKACLKFKCTIAVAALPEPQPGQYSPVTS